MIARVWVGLLASAACLALAQGESSKAARALPTASELRGWQEVKGSYQYGAGEGLTAIYDGGYMLYVNAGVVEAAQKAYRKNSLYLTITTHAMRTAAAAAAFLQHWEKANAKEKRQSTPGRGKGFVVQSGGATNVYWVHGGYFVTIMVTGADAAARKEAFAALGAVAKRLPSPAK